MLIFANIQANLGKICTFISSSLLDQTNFFKKILKMKHQCRQRYRTVPYYGFVCYMQMKCWKFLRWSAQKGVPVAIQSAKIKHPNLGMGKSADFYHFLWATGNVTTHSKIARTTNESWRIHFLVSPFQWMTISCFYF